MRILWSSNAPWGHTGYGNQTGLFLPRLKALGHEVAGHFWYGLEGGSLNWNGIPLYPKARDGYGNDIVGAHAHHFKADLVISLIDAWVLSINNYQGVKWAPWFPVDMQPIPPPVLNAVKDSYQPIVFSQFGLEESRKAGLDARYVPHGVETAKFCPGDLSAARQRFGWKDDWFVVGMVAANKGTPSRKSYPQQLEAFARFAKKHSDARIYLHTNQGTTDGMGGVNLPELCAYLGIMDRVLWADPYQLTMGYPDDVMADLYRAFDVLMNTSMGEGFGIPILEAQASGCPVIVGDWTAMSELCFGGWKIAKTDADPFWTPLAAYQYVPRIGALVEALKKAKAFARSEPIRQKARDGAMAYDADRVAEQFWRPVLEEIAQRIDAERPYVAEVAA